jgi:hypothetical protein
MNLFEKPNIDKNYDLIYFSNILFFSSLSLEDFKNNLLNEYINHLNSNGILVLNYSHHFAGLTKNKPLLNDIKANNLNEDILNCLSDIINIKKEVSSSGFGKGIYEDDLVLALRKY